MATNFIQAGLVLTVTAPRTVTSGEGVLVGTGLFGVAQGAATSGDTDLEVETRGVYELPKESGLSVSPGDLIYWDNTAFECDKTSSNTPIGLATETSGVGATTVKVLLIPGFSDGTVNATNVNAAGAVMESDFDAQTVLAAVADNTPLPVTIADSQFVGRPAGGDLGAMTKAQALTLLNVEDGADVTDATNVGTAAQDLIAPEHLAVLNAQIGVPFVIETDISAAAAAVDVFAGDCPHKIRVIDAFVRCTAANAGGTAKLNKGSVATPGNDVTDAMTMAVNKVISRAGTIDDAETTIAANGSLSWIKNAAGDDGTGYVWAVRVA